MFSLVTTENLKNSEFGGKPWGLFGAMNVWFLWDVVLPMAKLLMPDSCWIIGHKPIWMSLRWSQKCLKSKMILDVCWHHPNRSEVKPPARLLPASWMRWVKIVGNGRPMSLPTYEDNPTWDMGAVLRPGRFLPPSTLLPLPPPSPPRRCALHSLILCTGSDRRTSNQAAA